jgi:hypothetical protein
LVEVETEADIEDVVNNQHYQLVEEGHIVVHLSDIASLETNRVGVKLVQIVYSKRQGNVGEQRSDHLGCGCNFRISQGKNQEVGDQVDECCSSC